MIVAYRNAAFSTSAKTLSVVGKLGLLREMWTDGGGKGGCRREVRMGVRVLHPSFRLWQPKLVSLFLRTAIAVASEVGRRVGSKAAILHSPLPVGGASPTSGPLLVRHATLGRSLATLTREQVIRDSCVQKRCCQGRSQRARQTQRTTYAQVAVARNSSHSNDHCIRCLSLCMKAQDDASWARGVTSFLVILK